MRTVFHMFHTIKLQLLISSLLVKVCFSEHVIDITVNFNSTHQEIQGFGVYAGRVEHLIDDPNRDQILDLLYGKDGLQLQVIRFKVFPDFKFPNSTSGLTKMQADYLRVLQMAKQRYGVTKFIASAWSPPSKWKTINGSSLGYVEGKGFNKLALKHYEDFANYLADFVEWFARQGISIYAISPQNEPEFGTPHWDGCIWLPSDTGLFVRKYMRPVFKNRGLVTKIIVGETANWNVANLYLHATVGHLSEGDADIVASHGYSLPKPLKFKTVTYGFGVFPWLPQKHNLPRWITEVSATDEYDPSIAKGVEFGRSLNQFMIAGDVAGFVFWLGTVAVKSNEALIYNKDNVTLHKAYDVFGHFTRYVKAGWLRVDIPNALSVEEPQVSAFKSSEEKRFTVIVINTNYAHVVRCSITLQDIRPDTNNIKYILTNEEVRWQSSPLSLAENESSFNLTVNPLNIVTVSGSFVEGQID